MPILSPIEQLYFSFLQSGALFELDASMTGYINEDWDKWLKHYKLLSK